MDSYFFVWVHTVYRVMHVKRGISVWVALVLIAAALLTRVLLPDLTEQVREVFFTDGALDRIVEVFSQDAD